MNLLALQTESASKVPKRIWQGPYMLHRPCREAWLGAFQWETMPKRRVPQKVVTPHFLAFERKRVSKMNPYKVQTPPASPECGPFHIK